MDADLVTEITLQPVRRYGVDAAIFFSDIVLPLKAVGVDLDIKPGRRPGRRLAGAHARRRRGDPRPHRPSTSPSSRRPCTQLVAELGAHAADRLRRRAVHRRVLPRRGRAVEGAREDQGDDVRRPRRLGRADAQDRRHRRGLPPHPGRGRRLAPYSSSTRGPVRSPRPTTREHVMPHSARVLAAAGELGVPRIHFGVGTTNLLGLMGEAGADVVGVDWRTPLARRASPLVGDRVVQGNLDPTLVFAPTEVMTARAGRDHRGRPGRQGPHLQPRPRRHPVDRPRPAQGADGVRAGYPPA